MDDQKTKIAQAIWSELREDLDKCDLEVEDLHRGDRLWVYADVAHAAAQAEIARLRGALKRCREAFDSCTPGDYSTGHVTHPYFDEDAVNAAQDLLDGLGI